MAKDVFYPIKYNFNKYLSSLMGIAMRTESDNILPIVLACRQLVKQFIKGSLPFVLGLLHVIIIVYLQYRH